MKIFLDTGSLKDIESFVALGIVHVRHRIEFGDFGRG